MTGQGSFDADELVRWAQMYGHPEEWAKRAQAANMRVEDAEAEIRRLRAKLDTLIPPSAIEAAARAIHEVTAGGIPFGPSRRRAGNAKVSEREVHEPPARVLLCLESCRGEFYLPLGLDDPIACPYDPAHTVAVYSGPCLHQEVDRV